MAREVPNKFDDPFWVNLAASTEKKLDLPSGLVVSVLTQGERTNADRVSSAGARTPFQIIPQTRESAIKQYGVDPYLSPENAAEVAGRLLQDSLKRNAGDVEQAVGEYHGGTDRKAWGPVNAAYRQRVLAGMGQTAPADDGMSTFQRVQQARKASEGSGIADVYDAYKTGKMTAEDAATFEAAVANGEIMLPRGASLEGKAAQTPAQLGAKTEPQLAPQAVTDAYVNGTMDPKDRQQLEAWMQAGIVKLPPTATSQIPGEGAWTAPTEQGVIVPAKEPTLGERLLGAGETALALGTGMTGGALGTLTGTVGQMAREALAGQFGTREAADRIEQAGQQAASNLTYAPRTEQGQVQTQAAGEALQQLIPLGMLPGQMAALGQGARAAQPTVAATARAAAVPVQRAGAAAASGARQAAGAVAAAPGKVVERLKPAASREPEPFVPPVAAEPAAAETAPIGPRPSMGAAETVSPELFENQTRFQAKPEFAKAGQELPAGKQVERAQALRDIGLTEARKSAIVGDSMSGATESQIAKLDNEAGRKMRAQLDTERQALTDYAAKLADDVGGTQGADQASKISRGNAIIDPIEKYSEWFDEQSRHLYAEADKRASGVPISMPGLSALLKDKSVLTNADRVHLVKALKSNLNDIGMIDEKGIVSGNVKQAETVRKYLNENWSPANGKLVSRIKNVIDDQVMKSAGEDLYGMSRKMWQDKKNTIDNPKGIAALIDVDPQGINRKVSVEKIADNLWGQSNDQFQHVIRTLRQSPDEISDFAQKALTEIKSHFLNQLSEIGSQYAGQWNAKGVAKLLNQQNAKIQILFSPEEVAAMRTLNTAGNALMRDASYPGAAAQTMNLAEAGMTHAARLGSAAIGSMFGPLGAAAGAGVGSKAASMIAERAALNAVAKRIVSLQPRPATTAQQKF